MKTIAATSKGQVVIPAKIRRKLKIKKGTNCFAVALAKIRKGELVTGNKEFEAFKSEIKINWTVPPY